MSIAMNNRYEKLRAKMDEMGLDEVAIFKEEFLPSYYKTLDELH